MKPFETMIGTITLFDPKQRVGVISVKTSPMSKSAATPGSAAVPPDLVFEMKDTDLNRLRLGQLDQRRAPGHDPGIFPKVVQQRERLLHCVRLTKLEGIHQTLSVCMRVAAPRMDSMIL